MGGARRVDVAWRGGVAVHKWLFMSELGGDAMGRVRLSGCASADAGVGGREAGQAATEVAEFERARGAVCPKYQGVLPGPHDLLRGGIPAECRSEIRGALSRGAEPPGPGKPDHLPGGRPPGSIRDYPASPAPGWHAELLLPRRGLTRPDAARSLAAHPGFEPPAVGVCDRHEMGVCGC